MREVAQNEKRSGLSRFLWEVCVTRLGRGSFGVGASFVALSESQHLGTWLPPPLPQMEHCRALNPDFHSRHRPRPATGTRSYGQGSALRLFSPAGRWLGYAVPCCISTAYRM